MHFNRKLEDVIEAASVVSYQNSSLTSGVDNVPFALSLRLCNILAPHIAVVSQHSASTPSFLFRADSQSMSPDQHGMRVRPRLDSILKRIPQILLVGRVLNDRNLQSIKVPQISHSIPIARGDPLDLLEFFNLK